MPYTATIIVPILNEEKHIEKLLSSLEIQDYAKSDFEVYLIDGMSSDNTISLINKYMVHTKLNIRVFENPKRIQATAMNIGIKESTSKYIIRLDAHASYPDNYISSCIHILNETGADNVGFCIDTIGEGYVGELIAKAMSSKFGVGNSSFRINQGLQSADTVPFGAFKKEIFDKIGFYNEKLVCNEDNDLNERIKRSGGRILLSDKVVSIYYCRSSLEDFMKMAFRNGKWNVITIHYSRKSMHLRHFVPLLFFLSILILCILGAFHMAFLFLLLAELVLYLILDIMFSLKAISNIRKTPMLILIFFFFHFTYGLGSFIGFFDIFNILLKEEES